LEVRAGLPEGYADWPSLADSAGQRFADLLVSEGHEPQGIALSIDAFRELFAELMEDIEAPDPAALVERAVETARLRLKRRKMS
jgi:hypothetical protein